MFYVPIKMKQKLVFSGLHLRERQQEIFTFPAHGKFKNMGRFAACYVLLDVSCISTSLEGRIGKQ